MQPRIHKIFQTSCCRWRRPSIPVSGRLMLLHQSIHQSFAESVLRRLKPLRRRCAFGALLLPAGAGAAEPSLEVFRREAQPILEKYCFDCHGNGISKGGLTLDKFDTGAALRDHKVWFQALKNVRSGVMPPADEAQPTPAETEKLMAWIKREAFGLDPAKPDPGRVTVRRLNRVEYRNTVRDLMGVEFDTLKEFPADDTGHGFDNIADVLTISPILLEKYLDAAQTIIAKGVVTKPRTVVENALVGRQFATVRVDTTLPEQPKPATPPPAAMAPAAAAAPADIAIPGAVTPAVSAPAPQPGAVVAGQAPAGAPGPALPGRGKGRGPGFGQGGRGRGGPPPMTKPVPVVENDSVILSYYTPALVAAKLKVEQAGKYQIVWDLFAHETYAENQFDLNKCRVVLSLNGETLLEQEFVREGYSKKFEYTFDRELPVGEHEVSLEIKPIGPDTPQYRRLRIRLNSVTARGPLAPEFWVPTPGYAKYFPREVPADAPQRRLYAREVLEKFTTRAFRGPVEAEKIESLVALAERIYSLPGGVFETGVTQAMVATLASSSFLFREDQTEPLKPGQTHPFINEHALASRLSYFLWSSMPDDELLQLARTGKLRANLKAQLDRMLADARAQEFVRNFTGQWLQARDIATVAITAEEIYLRDHPNPELTAARETFARLQAIPQGNRTEEDVAALQKARGLTFEFTRTPKPELTERLRRSMLQETEMSFAHLIKEDRSLLELLESDYTFLNEELAKHYGIEDVTGAEMRKVQLPPGSPRGGILTQGTILAVTSNPTRTSPVKRGVFILDSILGTPAAPPPPNIPSLEDAAPAAKLRTMTLRETLALHATDPLCASCHTRMDPLGLALENFNAMGQWRTADSGQPVQPAGKLASGEAFADIRELKHILATKHQREFFLCLTEKLMTYALGRDVEYYDTVTVDRLVAALEASGGKPSVLLHGIVNSAPFQQRRQTTASLAGHGAPTLPSSTNIAQTSP